MVKSWLVILVVLVILLGVPYGLAKMGVIPVAKLTAKNPPLAKFARSIGLMPRPRAVKADTKVESNASLPKPAKTPPSTSRPAPPALAPLSRANSAAAGNRDSASRQVSWVAKVYENMEPEQAVRILERMNDREVVDLLRRMKQRQVAQILALMPPDRAARLSKTLMIQR